VRATEYTEADEHALVREAAKRVGDDMKVDIEYVSVLPRSSIGKLRFVVSTIPGASIEAPSATWGSADRTL
jgi:hypothetical protein